MKKLIILIAILITSKSYTQIENFHCENVSKSKLLEKYEQYKSGFELIHNGVDAIELTIDQISSSVMKQMCINAWGEVYNNSASYTYGKFKRRNFNISYDAYSRDIQYLEILSELRYQLIINLN